MDYQTSMVKHSKAIAVTAQEMVSIQNTRLYEIQFYHFRGNGEIFRHESVLTNFSCECSQKLYLLHQNCVLLDILKRKIIDYFSIFVVKIIILTLMPK